VGELEALLDNASRPIAVAALAALQQLAADDSRKVAARAQASLSASFEKANRAQQPAEQPPIEPTRSAQHADQQRIAEPQAGAERAVAAEPTPLANADTETQKSAGAVAPMPAVVLRLLIVTGGWMAGWVGGILLASIIDSNLVTFLSLIASWGIAALITGLILRRVVPSLQNYHIVVLIIVWALVPLAGIITQGSGGSGSDDYINKPNLIVSIAIIWLMNSWFVLQLPPAVMWWQALVVSAAGAVGWVIAGTFSWYSVALKIAGYGWSLPAAFHEAGYTTVNLMSNVILSSLLGGGALAVMYWLAHRSEKSI
jgi:hypothetical protein